MACTHDPKARAMCDAADKYSKPSSEWDERMTTLSKSRFCPLPDTDPNMICQVEKWYFAVTSQHDRAMNGLDSFEGFQLNRFKFKRKELFKESFDNYIRCGNNCTNLDWHKGPFSRDMTFAGIFHIPTCKSDNLRLMDFTQFWGWKAHPGKSWNGYQTGEWTTWNFPAVCGDHHASETQGFLEAMNAGIHSDVYAHHYYYRSTDQLWKDRIPRVSGSIPFCIIELMLTLPHSNLRQWASSLMITSLPCVGQAYICLADYSLARVIAEYHDLLNKVFITDVRTSPRQLP